MRDQNAGDTACNLRDHVERGIARRNLLLQPHHERHGGIEMCTRNGPKDRDQHEERRARRQGVSKQRQSGVSAR